jgi:hypothetical protein
MCTWHCIRHVLYSPNPAARARSWLPNPGPVLAGLYSSNSSPTQQLPQAPDPNYHLMYNHVAYEAWWCEQDQQQAASSCAALAALASCATVQVDQVPWHAMACYMVLIESMVSCDRGQGLVLLREYGRLKLSQQGHGVRNGINTLHAHDHRHRMHQGH